MFRCANCSVRRFGIKNGKHGVIDLAAVTGGTLERRSGAAKGFGCFGDSNFAVPISAQSRAPGRMPRWVIRTSKMTIFALMGIDDRVGTLIESRREESDPGLT